MSDGEDRTGERLQKILARAGVVPSRRKAEELITEGRVTINGQVAGLGDRADASKDSIKVDGKRVAVSTSRTYLLLNKPKGVLTTVEDPEGRPTVMALIPPQFRKALVPVGRLDFMTEGLLILTDDGDFAQRLAHPRYGCHKTYAVKVSGEPDERELDKLRQGVVIDGHKTSPSRIERTKPPGGPREGDNAWFQVELAEGRSRQIREMFERIGHPVQKLRRVAIGPVRDADLPLGSVRELSEDEVEKLRRATARPKTKEETARSLAPKVAPRATAPTAKGLARPSRPVVREGAEVRAVPAKRRGPAGGNLVPTRFAEVRKWRDAAPTPEPEPRMASAPVRSDERPARRPSSRPTNRPMNRPMGGPSSRPDRPSRPASDRPSRPASDRPSRPAFARSDRPSARPSGRPSSARPPGRSSGRPAPRPERPVGPRPSRPPGERPPSFSERPSRPPGSRPSFTRSAGSRPPGDRPFRPRPAADRPPGARPSGPRPPSSGPTRSRPTGPRPSGARPSTGRSGAERPAVGRPGGARPGGSRPGGARPGGGRPGGARPGGPRAGGPRPGGSARPRSGPPSGGPRRPR